MILFEGLETISNYLKLFQTFSNFFKPFSNYFQTFQTIFKHFKHFLQTIFKPFKLSFHIHYLSSTISIAWTGTLQHRQSPGG